MGEKDSSKTRVVPLMRFLGEDVNRINDFLSMFSFKNKSVRISDRILKVCYGNKSDGEPGEMAVPPVKPLLIWYAEHPEEMDRSENRQDKYGHPSAATIRNREEFFNGNPEKKKEAVDNLKNMDRYPSRLPWYIFEGKTYPDIYIETESFIFIGEAKRTEPHLTGTVKWYKKRDQLIRHVDSIIDSDKTVHSFFILEHKDYENLEKHGSDTGYYEESLPHRKAYPDQIRKVMDTYIGCITWDELGMKFPELKEKYL